MKLNELLDSLGNDGKNAKAELEGLLKALTEVPDERVKKIGGKISKYLDQLAAGAISEQDCLQYFGDLKRELASYADKMAVVAKAKMQQIESTFLALVIEKIVPMIVKAIANGGKA